MDLKLGAEVAKVVVKVYSHSRYGGEQQTQTVVGYLPEHVLPVARGLWAEQVRMGRRAYIVDRGN